MNYRDFYKNNKSVWEEYYHLIPEGITKRQFEKGAEEEYKEHPQVGRGGAARIAVQHLAKNPREYENLEEKELLKGMNLEGGAGDEDFPRREDGALDAVHDGRPIHLAKIIQVGAEFGKGPANGEVGGYSNVGVQSKSQGKDQSKDEGGVKVTQDGDGEPITAGGKEVDSSIASKSVGSDVVKGGGQQQGGPNTAGSIAGTPKIGGGDEGGEDGMTLSLQEAKSKLRSMVKEVLKEIRFDKESGKWVRLTEADKVDMKMGPSYKAPAGRQYKTSDDDQARKVEYEPEITEINDEEEEKGLYERYSELANAKRNLSESELDELRDLGMKLDKINEAKVDMKMGPSYKVVQPTLAKTSEPDQFSRINQYDPEVSESAEEEEECMDEAKTKKFLQKGIKKSHKGYCTPMTKSTCTPRRKALARRLKPGGDLYKGDKEEQDEVAPPGWEGTVKAMKKHKDIDNPWALAWSMKKKGAHPHKEEQEEDMKKHFSPEWREEQEEGAEEQEEAKKFLQKIQHTGACTPMSKPSCTPRRKALARRLKPGGDLYKDIHGEGYEEEEECMDEAGGAAVQHSSGRTVNDMPQIVKNRHRGDIDETDKMVSDKMLKQREKSRKDYLKKHNIPDKPVVRPGTTGTPIYRPGSPL